MVAFQGFGVQGGLGLRIEGQVPGDRGRVPHAHLQLRDERLLLDLEPLDLRLKLQDPVNQVGLPVRRGARLGELVRAHLLDPVDLLIIGDVRKDPAERRDPLLHLLQGDVEELVPDPAREELLVQVGLEVPVMVLEKADQADLRVPGPELTLPPLPGGLGRLRRAVQPIFTWGRSPSLIT